MYTLDYFKLSTIDVVIMISHDAVFSSLLVYRMALFDIHILDG